MATFYDIIQKNKTGAPQQQQTGSLQDIARIAQTGKALQSTGPKASTLGEQRAMGQVGAAGKQL
jgi:hypothetical protein